MNMTTEQRLADALRECAEYLAAFFEEGSDHPAIAAADEALAAYDAQQAQAAGLDEAIMQMGKPWHLSGAAEEYGFYHGKVAAAMLVRKSLGPLRAAEDETHA